MPQGTTLLPLSLSKPPDPLSLKAPGSPGADMRWDDGAYYVVLGFEIDATSIRNDGSMGIAVRIRGQGSGGRQFGVTLNIDGGPVRAWELSNFTTSNEIGVELLIAPVVSDGFVDLVQGTPKHNYRFTSVTFSPR